MSMSFGGIRHVKSMRWVERRELALPLHSFPLPDCDDSKKQTISRIAQNGFVLFLATIVVGAES